jgi:hypothetical protein
MLLAWMGAAQQQLWAHGRGRNTARLDWSDRSQLGCRERARLRSQLLGCQGTAMVLDNTGIAHHDFSGI